MISMGYIVEEFGLALLVGFAGCLLAIPTVAMVGFAALAAASIGPGLG